MKLTVFVAAFALLCLAYLVFGAGERSAGLIWEVVPAPAAEDPALHLEVAGSVTSRTDQRVEYSLQSRVMASDVEVRLELPPGSSWIGREGVQSTARLGAGETLRGAFEIRTPDLTRGARFLLTASFTGPERPPVADAGARPFPAADALLHRAQRTLILRPETEPQDARDALESQDPEFVVGEAPATVGRRFSVAREP